MEPRYKEIVAQIANAIYSGAILAGTKLPTHRTLSKRHHISLVTATRVYAELKKMGLVSGETGRGTFVREFTLPSGQGIDQYNIASDVIDLNFNYPSLPEQADLLRVALKRLATMGDMESMLHYQPHGGRLQERSILAQYLSTQGICCDSNEVMIVNGIQHGLTVTLMGLLKSGDIVVVDALTYPGFIILAKQLNIELVTVPISKEGTDLIELENICQNRRVKAVYIMPTMHNPLSCTMNQESRIKLITIAQKYNFFIIEDAAYSWLIEKAPLPLYHYDQMRVVYLSGFSKNIATGLRVGVVVAPTEQRILIERAIRLTTWNTPNIMVAIICGWIQDGTVLRLEKLKRKDAVLRQKIVKEVLQGLIYQTDKYSYFLMIFLPEEVRSDHVVSDLLKEHVSVSTAEPFCASLYVPHAIRVALGSVNIHSLKSGLEKIKSIIEFYTDL